MYSLTDKLLQAVRDRSLDEVLKYLKKGAKASRTTNHCGRTAVGLAALYGNMEILQLLMKSCEEPKDSLFDKGEEDSSEGEEDDDIDMKTTPEGMDHLEWEDEFKGNKLMQMDGSGCIEESATLYLYYAKTLESIGEIITEEEESRKNVNVIYRKQDPHAPDYLSMTPLHYAVGYDNYEAAEFLLIKGAKINFFNGNGCSPLHLAVQNPKVLELLLKYGAAVNARTVHSGETALHIAVRSHYYQSAEILMKYKANVNEVDYILQTPLICVATSDCNVVFDSLIQNGAKLNIEDHAGKNALYFAVMQNNLELARKLLEAGARRVPGHFLVHECARFNLFKMAALLISFGEPYNLKDREGFTPTNIAVIRQNAEILEFLLEVRRDELFANYRSERTDSELLLAVNYISHFRTFQKITRILLAKGAAPFLTETPLRYTQCYKPFCHSPLSRALMLQKFREAEFLIKEGVDVNELCRDHIINMLRSDPTATTLRFTKFIMMAGFPHSFRIFQLQVNKNGPVFDNRKQYDDAVLAFCSNPLSLKERCRLIIRKALVERCVTAPEETLAKYGDSEEFGILSNMARQLVLPKCLIDFILNFPDYAQY